MAVLRSSRSFKDGIVVVAFPGLGFVGTIAGRYVVEKMNMKWIGYIHDERLPPIAKVKDGNILYPVNIFSSDHVYLILSEVMPPEETVWDVSRQIVSKAKKDGAKYIVVISGVLMPGGDGVYGIGSNSTARRIMESLGIEEIEKGVITGVSATILLHSREAGVPAFLLLGPAQSQQDFNAAITVVKKMSDIFEEDIPTEDLVDLAQKYEHEIKTLQRQLESSPSVPMYG